VGIRSQIKKQEVIARANIVVVGFDQRMRVEIASIFKKLKWNNVKYVNGPAAFFQLDGSVPFDLVLVDEKLSEGGAVEFAKTLDRLHGMPIGLIGNIDNIVDTSVGYHPDEQFFAFSLPPAAISDEIADLVAAIMLPDKLTDPTGDLAYCKVHIDDFISGRQARFPLYVRLARGKYIKIAHSGDPIDLARLDSFRKKNVRYLYMKKMDFSKYVGFAMQLATGVSASTKIPQKKKVSFMRHLGEALVESCYFEGVKENFFQESAIYVESITSVLIDSDDVFKILNSLREASDRVFVHSAAVSLYSVVIAKHLGWDSPNVLFKIGTAGLLHDIGKKDFAREILNKDPNDLTHEERQVYETHTTRGMQELSRLHNVPAEIVQVVLEHHENCLGQGFPQGLKRDRIHPMARLIAVADEFCQAVMNQKPHEKHTAVEVIDRLYKTNLVLFDPAYFAVLMAVFKMEVPLKLKLHYEKGGLRGRKTAA